MRIGIFEILLVIGGILLCSGFLYALWAASIPVAVKLAISGVIFIVAAGIFI